MTIAVGIAINHRRYIVGAKIPSLGNAKRRFARWGKGVLDALLIGLLPMPAAA